MIRKIAILTSGGDAPGMNACLRACIRAGLDKLTKTSLKISSIEVAQLLEVLVFLNSKKKP